MSEILVLMILLIAQSTGVVVFTRMYYISQPSYANFHASFAVILCEFLKTLASLCFYQRECNAQKHRENVMSLLGTVSLSDILQLLVPSVLYVLQNNLQYISISYLPAELFQVLIQSKILFTAVFSWLLLQRSPSKSQWIAIVIHVVGIAFVETSHLGVEKIMSSLNQSRIMGVICVFTSAIISGFAGVFYERFMKSRPKVSLWKMNFIVNLVSVCISLPIALIKDHSNIAQQGLWIGFTPLTWIIIIFHAGGGLLVPLLVSRSSSIAKCFVYSVSVILTCAISSIFMNDFQMDSIFALGVALVVLSMLLYNNIITPPKVSK